MNNNENKQLEKTQNETINLLKILKSLTDSEEIINNDEIENIKLEIKELLKNLPEVEKNKIGRPSKYRSKYCLNVIDYMSRGLSKNSVACKLGIAVKNMTEWSKHYPEFHMALKIGEQLSKHWWEEVGRLNIYNKNFNSTLYMMQMQNRHGWTRRLDGNIHASIENVNTERKEVILKIERSDEHVGKVLEILHRNGAIESGIKTDIETPSD